MAFGNRREYLFIYSVKDANPNGDPLNANHPRYDEESGQILVSDVRIKRTVRDQWINDGLDVFVDGETKTLKQRVEELKEKFSVKTGQEALAQCIDTRLFGVTFALGSESFAWTGPVQFKWGRSMHKADAMTVQGTAAFATKEDSGQRSFRNEYIVPFVLIADYGIANQSASLTTGASDADLEKLFGALWNGTANLITRSKIGHTPRLLIEVAYNDGFCGITGAMDEKVSLKNADGSVMGSDCQRAVRSCDAVSLDVQPLREALARNVSKIKAVRIIKDAALKIIDFDALTNLLGEKLKLEER